MSYSGVAFIWTLVYSFLVLPFFKRNNPITLRLNNRSAWETRAWCYLHNVILSDRYLMLASDKVDGFFQIEIKSPLS